MTADPTYRILLLSCYELGHQPLSLAWPLAALEQAGFQATAVDLATGNLPAAKVENADFVGIAVPMHTALRLGVRVAAQVRARNPSSHICFYGLYAWLNADFLLDGIADSVIAGEYERPLIALVNDLLAGGDGSAVLAVSTPTVRKQPHLARPYLPTPKRDHLPGLENYARYMFNGSARLAGYVETSRGCLHTCRHCPVVPVYNGRFFIVPLETVMADIRQQVAAGACHITFGDPDFLNGPGHALKVARALHAEFPDVTFDFTTKVEHILLHHDLLQELCAYGAKFVVSAFEAVDDFILQRLQKGHTLADMDAALDILHAVGLQVQPTLVAFTPWITLAGYIDLLCWIRERDLIQHIPAVQLSVRLLVPPKSALLVEADTKNWLGSLDPANFTYTWQHPDPRMDELQRYVAALAEMGGDAYAVFRAIETRVYGLAERPLPDTAPPTIIHPAPPRLTEDWFC
ncbi:MAG: radical SAM protein [Anaerolineales bacterium]|nr:radical SAM protein [Anaerolineales bacterium]